MAKIHEENLVITVSRLVKGNEKPKTLVLDSIVTQLEEVMQELVGSEAVVEVTRAPN